MLQYVFRKGSQFLNNNVKKQHFFVAYSYLSVAFALARRYCFTEFVRRGLSRAMLRRSRG